MPGGTPRCWRSTACPWIFREVGAFRETRERNSTKLMTMIFMQRGWTSACNGGRARWGGCHGGPAAGQRGGSVREGYGQSPPPALPPFPLRLPSVQQERHCCIAVSLTLDEAMSQSPPTLFRKTEGGQVQDLSLWQARFDSTHWATSAHVLDLVSLPLPRMGKRGCGTTGRQCWCIAGERDRSKTGGRLQAEEPGLLRPVGASIVRQGSAFACVYVPEVTCHRHHLLGAAMTTPTVRHPKDPWQTRPLPDGSLFSCIPLKPYTIVRNTLHSYSHPLPEHILSTRPPALTDSYE